MRNYGSRKDAHLSETTSYIKKHTADFTPFTGIILGTGLGGLVRDVNVKYKIDYCDIPHFPVSTVESHHGNLIFGELSGREVVIMQGRFHYYEGYSMSEIIYPVSVMGYLGVKNLIVSNACGAVNPLFSKADLMVMKDHINFFFDNPISIGSSVQKKNSNKSIYSKHLITLTEKTALENNIQLQKGVYLALRGPALETSSEYRFIRKLGADVVGMSTIPEVLKASSISFNVLGLSIITDVGFPDSLKPAALEEILEAASEAEPQLTLLTKKVLEKI